MTAKFSDGLALARHHHDEGKDMLEIVMSGAFTETEYVLMHLHFARPIRKCKAWLLHSQTCITNLLRPWPMVESFREDSMAPLAIICHESNYEMMAVLASRYAFQGIRMVAFQECQELQALQWLHRNGHGEFC